MKAVPIARMVASEGALEKKNTFAFLPAFTIKPIQNNILESECQGGEIGNFVRGR